MAIAKFVDDFYATKLAKTSSFTLLCWVFTLVFELKFFVENQSIAMANAKFLEYFYAPRGECESVRVRV